MNSGNRKRERRAPRIKRETLRVLDPSDLELVVGGVRDLQAKGHFVNGRLDTRYCLA